MSGIRTWRDLGRSYQPERQHTEQCQMFRHYGETCITRGFQHSFIYLNRNSIKSVQFERVEAERGGLRMSELQKLAMPLMSSQIEAAARFRKGLGWRRTPRREPSRDSVGSRVPEGLHCD